ncbi:alpha-1,3-mannosyl-glycoprotein 4-beta-N-acetylglucosaminyltransferase C isoform X2 [Gouania willdenowi]|uniref:Alpha-1,3-mannosyl-glycoprotein 4-beta-N-acetylglucosaminyltransferase C-like n=2 Tax=Gouania willdenowi TaxID=441366 RepID=A0A8C5G342_GOUWI|nr:alpha-1,3-mannosyl-glycoprotein 4-beta-N-acetylglucosaminyltransferase C-like isoform X2 [Gouania willdenowi]
MRCVLKKRNVVLGGLFLLGGFFVTSLFNLLISALGPSPEAAPLEFSWEGNRPISLESWVEQGQFLPLNVSYQLLAGTPASQQRYLTIGMSSVKRKKGSYLIPTLESVFSQSSPQELSSLQVVVLLADFDLSWIMDTVKRIKEGFSSELDQGQLLIIHVPQVWYPPVTGLKRNYNDASDRVTFRSKQNLDYSFLTLYSAGLGRYYLQLEDDVSSAKNFFTSIKTRIEEQEAKKSTWATLEFSSLGYIGKLYKSAHLPLLSRFLFLFYQEMPCDWLMTHFRELMTQREQILFKPSLFQHMGTFSSFKGTYNKLKDKNFEESLYTNPSAKVYSDMSTYQKHFPQLAWDSGEGFFWGRSPEKGNYLTVVFTEPVVVTEILVETGSGKKDLLESAQVELGQDVLTKEEESCKSFYSLGPFKNGKFEMYNIDAKYSSVSSCLRIQVTAPQKDWVVIHKIRVKTKTKNT